MNHSVHSRWSWERIWRMPQVWEAFCLTVYDITSSSCTRSEAAWLGLRPYLISALVVQVRAGVQWTEQSELWMAIHSCLILLRWVHLTEPAVSFATSLAIAAYTTDRRPSISHFYFELERWNAAEHYAFWKCVVLYVGYLKLLCGDPWQQSQINIWPSAALLEHTQTHTAVRSCTCSGCASDPGVDGTKWDRLLVVFKSKALIV